MVDNGAFRFFASSPDEKCYCHALADVENVLILAAIGTGFLLEQIAVQVEDVDFVKGVHQALTHAAEGRIVEIGVVRNHADDTATGLLDLPLGETQELHVVVLEPLRVLLAQWFAVHFVVVLEQAANPLAPVGGTAGIGRIAENYQNRRVLLDGSGEPGFVGEGGQSGQAALFQFLDVQGVRQKKKASVRCREDDDRAPPERSSS